MSVIRKSAITISAALALVALIFWCITLATPYLQTTPLPGDSTLGLIHANGRMLLLMQWGRPSNLLSSGRSEYVDPSSVASKRESQQRWVQFRTSGVLGPIAMCGLIDASTDPAIPEWFHLDTARFQPTAARPGVLGQPAGFGVELVVPHALLVLLFGTWPTFVAYRWPRRRRIACGCCPTCGYDLRGSAQSATCPECGASNEAAPPTVKVAA